MHYFEVAPTAIIRTGSDTFTYASQSPLPIGQLVVIEVGKKQLTGIITSATKKPSYETKSILSTIEAAPLPTELIKLAFWLKEYYNSPLATVLQTLLPRGLQKNRRDRLPTHRDSLRDRTTIVLTKDQRDAVQAVESMTPGSALVHGVTGSGKTHIYIELAKRTLARNQSVIILVPEIALTSQVVDEFSHHFENIILVHSRQTEAERHLAWQDALNSKSPRVVIGPRSALFTPLHHLGLIVIDEAHEPSFKQEQSPRYSALRAASVLTRLHDAKLILGSATPLVTDYYLAAQSDRPIITLPERAKKDATPPTITLVDMTKKASFTHHRFLSNTLLSELEASFSRGDQVLIFHNRRGSASTTLCENCGWSATCPQCFIPLTLHADAHHLRCHLCGRNEKVPTSCPTCHSADIIHKGIGTKLIESELRKRYPDKVIVRFDGDNESGDTVESRYNDLYSGAIDIIIGTQVIAKGLDLPKLRLVGVIQADAGLALPDYTSSERTFQLLAQVVGRVGRSHHPTTVVVQSYQPNHLAVTTGLAQNYEQFYDTTIDERRRANFPPFTYLLKLTCIYKTEIAAIKNAKKLATELHAACPQSVQILGPTPSFYERQRDTYRWQLVLKSPRRADLVAALALVPPTHWQSELDPMSLL